MTVSPVGDHLTVIEQLLNDEFARDEAPSSPSPAVIALKFQDALRQALADLQNDMNDGKITLLPQDKGRLNAIFQKILKLEGMTHARLSWFSDLEASLRDGEA